MFKSLIATFFFAGLKNYKFITKVITTKISPEKAIANPVTFFTSNFEYLYYRCLFIMSVTCLMISSLIPNRRAGLIKNYITWIENPASKIIARNRSFCFSEHFHVTYRAANRRLILKALQNKINGFYSLTDLFHWSRLTR